MQKQNVSNIFLVLCSSLAPISTRSIYKSVKPRRYIFVSRHCNLHQFVSTKSSDHFDSTQNMLKNILRMPAIRIRSNPIKRLKNPQLNPFKIFKYAAVACAASVAAVSADHPPPVSSYHPAPAPSYHVDETPKPYAFEYGVHDDYAGTNFHQSEHADEHAVEGSYSVLLPDGRTQTVTYHADRTGYGGFVADVHYDGHAAHPPVHKPAPAYHAPVVHKPIVHPAPVYHAPKPVYHPPPTPVYKPAPVVTPVYKPAPVVHKTIVKPAPAPAYHAPAPKPAYHPPPVVHKPIVHPAPAYHAPAPVVVHKPVPSPVYHAPAPTPVYHPPPTPVYHEPAPVVHEPIIHPAPVPSYH